MEYIMQYIKIKHLNHYKFALLFTNQGPSSVVPIRPRRTFVRIPTRQTRIPTEQQVSPEHYISLLIKISILVYHIFYVKSNKKGGVRAPLSHSLRSFDSPLRELPRKSWAPPSVAPIRPRRTRVRRTTRKTCSPTVPQGSPDVRCYNS